MADTLVKEKICNACGAEVRPQAVFCYNCGSAVSPDGVSSNGDDDSESISNAWFRGDLVDEEKEITAPKNNKKKNRRTSGKDETQDRISDSDTTADNSLKVEKEKRDLDKMESAANLRRRGKSVQKKRVEIVWEEHDNAPNGWFIFFAVIFAILAVVIWVISTYLE